MSESTHVAFIGWNEKGFWQMDVYVNDECGDEPGDQCYWCTGKKGGDISEMEARASKLYPNARLEYRQEA